MKKILIFESTEKEYTLRDKNSNNKKDPFKIEKSKMEFNTSEFYEYVFSDIDEPTDILITNECSPKDKEAGRVYETIDDICQGVNELMREREV